MSKNFKNPYLQSEYNNNDAKYETSNPYLSHGWGNSAAQKQKERDYNRAYYEKHKKDKWGVGLGSSNRGSGLSGLARSFQDNFNTGMDMITGQSRKLARQEEESARRLANHRRTGGAAKNEREKQLANERNYRYSNIAREAARNEASRPINVQGYYKDQMRKEAQARKAGVASNYAQNEMARQDAARRKHAIQNRSNAYAQNEMAKQNSARSQYESTRKGLQERARANAYAQSAQSGQSAARSQYENTRASLNAKNRSDAYAQNEMSRRVNQGNSDVLSAVRQAKVDQNRRNQQGQARANAYAQSAQANQESARSRYDTVNDRMARDYGQSAVLDAVKNAKAENRGRSNYLSGKRSNAYAQNEMAKNASNQSQYESTRKGLQEQARANAYAQNEMSRRANNSSELIPQISNQKTAQNVNAYAKNVAKINENINKMTDEYNKADKSIKQLETMYPDILGGRSPIIQKQIDKLKEEKSRLAVDLNEWKQYRNRAQRELEAEKSKLR